MPTAGKEVDACKMTPELGLDASGNTISDHKLQPRTKTESFYPFFRIFELNGNHHCQFLRCQNL